MPRRIFMPPIAGTDEGAKSRREADLHAVGERG
jgi:hypothetical protein